MKNLDYYFVALYKKKTNIHSPMFAESSFIYPWKPEFSRGFLFFNDIKYYAYPLNTQFWHNCMILLDFFLKSILGIKKISIF